MACTEDYLLSKINLETGEETPLLQYDNFNFSNCSYPVSTKGVYSFIAIDNIVTPYINLGNGHLIQEMNLIFLITIHK